MVYSLNASKECDAAAVRWKSWPCLMARSPPTFGTQSGRVVWRVFMIPGLPKNMHAALAMICCSQSQALGSKVCFGICVQGLRISTSTCICQLLLKESYYQFLLPLPLLLLVLDQPQGMHVSGSSCQPRTPPANTPSASKPKEREAIHPYSI